MKKLVLLLSLLLLFPTLALATNYGNDANCMGYWAMEDSGTETDLSGEGGDLAESGGTIPQDADRKFGDYSRDFELDDSEILWHTDGGSTDIFGENQKLSMVLWYKREADSGTYEGLMTKWRSTDNDRQYLMIIANTDDIQMWLSSDGSASSMCIGGSTIGTGAWVHMAGVYNDTDIRIYKDGSLDSNGVDNPKTYSSGISDQPDGFAVGGFDGTRTGTPSLPADGLIDDAAIFDRDLTSVEVSDIETNGAAGTVSARRIWLSKNENLKNIDFAFNDSIPAISH